MRYSSTLHERYLAAVLFTAVGLAVYGCGDSATVNPEVELSRLSVTPGSLQPGFGGGTTQYRVDLTSDITTVTVSAQAAVAGDRVTINGQPTTSRSIALDPPGSTTVVNVVVADTDTNSRTYVVRLVRAGLAGNNSLQNLDVSAGSLTPGFNANELLYTVDVANTVGSITVTPTLSDPAATMTVNGQDTNSGQPLTINLEPAGQSTTIRIDVTAQNGNTKTYLVVVSRGVSSNRNLQSLGISPGSLSPSFSANREDYTVNVGSAVGSISVTPRLQDSNATMRVNGQPTNSGQARSITLAPAGSSSFINIVVIAQNNTSRTYSVEVRRAALGGNNNLQSLGVSPGSLSPSFSANQEDYTVNVGSGVDSITVTPRLQDSNATMRVNGQPTNSGQARSITLAPAGSNTLISIVVTAQNGTQNTYSVEVRRAALGGNNNLQSLGVSPGSLSPSFNANQEDYTVNVGSGVDSIIVTPRLQDSNATMTVNGQSTNSGQNRPVALNGPGSNTLINVVVIAQNGSQKLYTMTVSRATLGGNNNLQSVGVSPGSLDPTFNANRTSYTVDVGSSVGSVTVTPTLQDTAATMTVNGQSTNSGQNRSVTLNGAGSNTDINIVVTAPNSTQKTYTITVERAALASNNNLSTLSVTPGVLDPAFTQNTLNYTVDVASTVTSVNMSATKADANAVMSGDVTAGTGVATGQAIIPLNGAGSNTTVSITVTAPNGVGKTYTITVDRAAPAAPAAPVAPTVAVDLIEEDDSCPLDIPNNPDQCLVGSKDDNITNVAMPRFSVTTPPAGTTPKLYINGIKDVDSTFEQGTLRPSTPFTDGDYTITYTLTNAGGESGESPPMAPQLRIITTPPPPPAP